MKIFLHELRDQETRIEFSEEENWVADAVAQGDENLDTPRPSNPSTKAARPISGHISLREVDNVVVVNGDLHTHIHLHCSRCAHPFKMPVDTEFSALFCQDPVMAGVGYLAGKPQGQNHGVSRGRTAEMGKSAHTSSEGDLDITYLSTDFIDLGDILSEQIRLLLPFRPLCKDECKGICSNCGADLNHGRCACSKIQDKDSPFSKLKQFRFKATEAGSTEH